MLWYGTMVPGENDITKVFFEDPITIVRSFMWTIFAKLFASQWHRLLMVMVWAATIAGVVLVAIELGGWPYDQVWWNGMGYCTLNCNVQLWPLCNSLFFRASSWRTLILSLALPLSSSPSYSRWLPWLGLAFSLLFLVNWDSPPEGLIRNQEADGSSTGLIGLSETRLMSSVGAKVIYVSDLNCRQSQQSWQCSLPLNWRRQK